MVGDKIINNIITILIAAVAAAATFYEYIYKYNLKKINILKYLKNDIDNIEFCIDKLFQLNLSFYNQNKEFINISYNYELIKNLSDIYLFYDFYNKKIINDDFKEFLNKYKNNIKIDKFGLPFVNYNFDINLKKMPDFMNKLKDPNKIFIMSILLSIKESQKIIKDIDKEIEQLRILKRLRRNKITLI